MQVDIDQLTTKERIALTIACELVIDTLDNNRE